jgi:hypothetical protein
VKAASEIGLEHDWLDPGCSLFRPAQSPGRPLLVFVSIALLAVTRRQRDRSDATHKVCGRDAGASIPVDGGSKL